MREQSRTPNDVCACARPELHAHGCTRVCSAEGKLGYHAPDRGGRSPEARAGGGRREGPRPRAEPSRSMHVYWQIIRNAGWRGLSRRLGLGETWTRGEAVLGLGVSVQPPSQPPGGPWGGDPRPFASMLALAPACLSVLGGLSRGPLPPPCQAHSGQEPWLCGTQGVSGVSGCFFPPCQAAFGVRGHLPRVWAFPAVRTW